MLLLNASISFLNGSTPSSSIPSSTCLCSVGRIFCHKSTWRARYSLNPNASSASIQTWLNLYNDLPSDLHDVRCQGLSVNPLSSLAFVVPPHTSPQAIPSLTATHQGTEYQLRTIIYHGSNYFAVRVLDDNGTFWSHDGQVLGGVLHDPHRATNDTLNWLTTMGANMGASIYSIDTRAVI